MMTQYYSADNFKKAFEQASTLHASELEKKDAQKNFEQFLNQGLPSMKSEEWLYTDLKPLSRIEFHAAQNEEKISNQDRSSALEACKKHFVEGALHIVMINNEILLNEAEDLGGFKINQHLNDLPPEDQRVHSDSQTFRRLNISFAPSRFVFSFQESLKKPLHILRHFTGPPKTFVPSALQIELHEGVQLDILESLIGDETLCDGLISVVSDLKMNTGAQVNLCRLQEVSRKTYLTLNTNIQAAAHSVTNLVDVCLGSKLCRMDLVSQSCDSSSEVNFSSASLLKKEQHLDLHSKVYHNHPEGRSQQLFKSVLTGKSRLVFNGKIHIAPNAQKVSSQMINKNLMLSPQAEVNTKPDLEIFADDVKAAHGATLSRISKEEVFYLQSRGIAEQIAQELLMTSFLKEVFFKIHNPNIRRHVLKLSDQRLTLLEKDAQ